MGKKTLPIVAVFILSMAGLGKSLAQDQVIVTLETITFGVGESSTVRAMIDCPLEGGCSGFDIEIRFDPTVMRIDDADVGPYLGDDSFLAERNIDNEAGIVRLAAVAVGAQPEFGEPTLFTLTVTSIAPGVATLSVYNVLIADLVGNPVEARGIAGAVVVQAAEGPSLVPTATATSPLPLPTTVPDAGGQSIEAAWAGSGHADAEAEAFRAWDEDDPKEVPTSCARCHSAYGYLDFVGADGSEAGVVDAAAPVDSVITCEVCHNEATLDLERVVFPSGAEVTGLRESTHCAVCHQGRASGGSVDSAIASAGVSDDEVSEDLRFINVHYFAAGATLFGSETMGIYQYEGKEYVGRNTHVPDHDTCAGCHDAHALTVKLDVCSMCHASIEDVDMIRMMSGDWDGDGVDEGVAGEVDTMRDALLIAIQAYAADTVGAPIRYDPNAYPYWFSDTTEGGSYATWTPRLLRAAYNYQYATKDPGAFAHNPKYVVQALYDSIEDLGGDVSGMTRP